MKIFKTLVVITLLLLSFDSFCQKKPEDIVIAFYDQLKSDPDAAIAAFMNPMSKDDDKLDEVRKAYKKIKNYYGDLGKMELVRKKNVGENLVELCYLFNHERYPVIVKFIFYRFDKEWRQVNFFFNDEIKKEFFSERN
jgi:hypothetical protein